MENGFIEILNKFVMFEDSLEIDDNHYQLVGVTSIETESNKYSRYRTYLLRENDEWLEYDGVKVKIVKKQIVMRVSAMALLYKKQ